MGSISLSVKFERPTPGGADSAALVPAGSAQQQQQQQQQLVPKAPGGGMEVRDPAGKFTDEEILEAFKAFDLDKNNYVGAAEIRHVLINIGTRCLVVSLAQGACLTGLCCVQARR